MTNHKWSFTYLIKFVGNHVTVKSRRSLKLYLLSTSTIPIVDVSGRRPPRSYYSDPKYTVHFNVGDHSFPLTGSRPRNSLPRDFTSVPTIAVFWNRLKILPSACISILFPVLTVLCTVYKDLKSSAVH